MGQCAMKYDPYAFKQYFLMYCKYHDHVSLFKKYPFFGNASNHNQFANDSHSAVPLTEANDIPRFSHIQQPRKKPTVSNSSEFCIL